MTGALGDWRLMIEDRGPAQSLIPQSYNLTFPNGRSGATATLIGMNRPSRHWIHPSIPPPPPLPCIGDAARFA